MSWFSVQEQNERHPFTQASLFIFNDRNPGVNMAVINQTYNNNNFIKHI